MKSGISNDLDGTEDEMLRQDYEERENDHDGDYFNDPTGHPMIISQNM